MAGAAVQPFPQVTNCSSRSNIPSSGVKDAQFPLSHVETEFLAQKSPHSGAILVNILDQAHLLTAIPSTTPAIGVPGGENITAQSSFENGCFPTFFPQNAQHIVGFSQPQIPINNGVNVGFQTSLNHQQSPTVFSPQIPLLPSSHTVATGGLSAECTDAVTVQTVSAITPLLSLQFHKAQCLSFLVLTLHPSYHTSPHNLWQPQQLTALSIPYHLNLLVIFQLSKHLLVCSTKPKQYLSSDSFSSSTNSIH